MRATVPVCAFSDAHNTMQDIRVHPTTRKTDPADSEYLDNKGPANFNHWIRKYMHNQKSVLIFPEPGALAPDTEE